MALEVRQETSQTLNFRPSLPLNDSGVRVVVVAAVFIALATLAVALRFYARYLKKVSYGLEDWFLLASTLVFYAYASTGILAVCVGGIGYHVNELSLAQLQRSLKITLALQILYAVGLGLIKCSICLMLIRVFFVKRFRLAGYSVMAFCTAWTLMTILLAFLLCRPLDYNWNLLPTAGHCGDQRSAYAAVGIIDIFSDVAILILPLPMVWKLQAAKATRLALTALLCLCVFTIAMSIARVVTIFDTEFKDFTFNTYNFCWPILEYGVAILVCCGPLLRPLFEKGALFSPGNRPNGTEDSSGNTTIQKPGRLGFSQLGEGEIPLQAMAAPTNVISITGNVPQHKHQTMLDDGVSTEAGLNFWSKGVNLPSQGINVERGWNVGDGNV